MCVTKGQVMESNIILLTLPEELRKLSHKLPPPAIPEDDLDNYIFGVILASHFSLKKGKKIFGKKAEATTMKELQQIHNMGAYKAQDAKKLTRQKTECSGVAPIHDEKEEWNDQK